MDPPGEEMESRESGEEMESGEVVEIIGVDKEMDEDLL
jgi:TusA-related sulfurtransferase